MTGDGHAATAVSRLCRISFRLVAAFLPVAGAATQDSAAEVTERLLTATSHCVVRSHAPFHEIPQQGSH